MAQSKLAKISVYPPINAQIEHLDVEITAVDAAMIVARLNKAAHKDDNYDLILKKIITKKNSTLKIHLESFIDKNIEVIVADSHDDSLILEPQGSFSRGQFNSFLTFIRKMQHIDLCKTQDVEAADKYTGFEELVLTPCSLPELNWEDINTSTTFLGQKFSYPILITGMTGGIEQGATINRRLALAAAHYNIPMGVGSQRIAIEDDQYAEIFAIRKYTPDLFLIGNIGIAQLRQGNELAICQKAVDMIEANALAIHVNVLQELIQEEGNKNFRYFLDRIAKIAEEIHVPLIIKEVGSGLDEQSAHLLKERGINVMDIGGKGGTSWGYIEGLRSNDPTTRSLGDCFRNWGIPTAHSLTKIRQNDSDTTLIATGGIRDGLTVAKAVALGADMVGIGLPLFKAALQADEAPAEVLSAITRELKISMLCSGCQDLSQLKLRIRHKSELSEDFATQIKATNVNIKHKLDMK
ncbi:MAG: type 2 isopentenyl-diphosphate Delta-isomerase [Bdellovibrionota bacterium]